SNLAKSGLSSELLKAIQTLGSVPQTRTLKAVTQRASAIQTLAGGASAVYGWKDQGPEPIVRIAIMADVIEPATQQAKAIEVSTQLVQASDTQGQEAGTIGD